MCCTLGWIPVDVSNNVSHELYASAQIPQGLTVHNISSTRYGSETRGKAAEQCSEKLLAAAAAAADGGLYTILAGIVSRCLHLCLRVSLTMLICS